MGKRHGFKLEVGKGGTGVAYLKLPGHPGDRVVGCVKTTTMLRDYIPDYKGPDILFNFAENDLLIGIEILA
jgi:hypothetical protein